MTPGEKDRMKTACSIYAEWLTIWYREDQSDVEESDFDFYGPYGYTSLLSSTPMGDFSGQVHYLFEVGYGDDGGNSFLSCIFYQNHLVHMSQGFDTMWQEIFRANGGADDRGLFVSTPKGEMAR